jgi:hypothetical protein
MDNLTKLSELCLSFTHKELINRYEKEGDDIPLKLYKIVIYEENITFVFQNSDVRTKEMTLSDIEKQLSKKNITK